MLYLKHSSHISRATRMGVDGHSPHRLQYRFTDTVLKPAKPSSFSRQNTAVLHSVILAMCLWMLPVSANSLSLGEATTVALQDDPVINARIATSQSLKEDAIADGQYQDPKFKFGLYNLPLDSLEIRENPTTQLRFGVQQAIPRGDTLKFKQKQTLSKALAEDAMTQDRRRKVLRDVREQYLEVWYQHAAAATIRKNQALFSQLVDITESQYATGRATQLDVLRAELELSRLQDKLTQILSQEDANRAMLSRWVGNKAQQNLANDFPILPNLPDQSEMIQRLSDHPLIQKASANVDSQQHMINIAEEQYKPSWNVGLEYRKRFGNEPDGSSRDDMMAAMATVSVPIFTDKRQDRRLAASIQRAESAKLMRVEQMRELRQKLDREYARWQRLDEREALYQSRLIGEAKATAGAALSAYQSGVTEFATLMRARITELNVQLEDLRLRVDKAQTTARLLYLTDTSETNELGATR